MTYLISIRLRSPSRFGFADFAKRNDRTRRFDKIFETYSSKRRLRRGERLIEFSVQWTKFGVRREPKRAFANTLDRRDGVDDVQDSDLVRRTSQLVTAPGSRSGPNQPRRRQILEHAIEVGTRRLGQPREHVCGFRLRRSARQANDRSQRVFGRLGNHAFFLAPTCD